MNAGSERGFLLMEVLIALAVLALGVSTCFYGLSKNSKILETMKSKTDRLEQVKLLQI